MSGLEFKYPVYLFLLLLPAAAAFVYIYFKIFNRETSIKISSVKTVKSRSTLRGATYKFLPLIRLVSAVLVIAALAGPGKGVDYTSVNNLGIDIMLVLDVSGSMRGEDFQPENRLYAAKQVLKTFVDSRTSDRIGLVVFAYRPYLQCPLTIEYDMLKDVIDSVDFDSVDADGTGIGDSLMLAVSRMKDRESKSKIILLVTDGVNNAGGIQPDTAAEIAKQYGIKIYSVGIGKEGPVPYPTNGLFSRKTFIENNFNAEVISRISEISGGKFYRAESDQVFLENIREIDKLEKTDYDVKVYYEFFDRFYIFLAAAAVLFLIEILLRSLVYRKVP
ncbi:MAG: VWA domain-containing protein [Spirochaetes bacterium]|nr:VWA domain-containing protein [Spirochaetota bacterium]